MNNFGRAVFLLLITGLCCMPVFANGNSESTSGKTVSFNETGYPIVDETITLEVLAARHMQHTEEFVDKEMVKNLEGKSNIHIEWEYLPHESDLQKQKFNLIFASGDLPDVILGGVDAARFGVAEQQLLPLNEYMQFAHNLKANIYPAVPGLEDQLKFLDGNIYGLPKGEIDPYRTIITLGMINQKWLDNLGMKLPTNLDELYVVLKAFKDQDPNGNGQADEIPFSFLPNHGVMGPTFIMNAFGVVDNGWSPISVNEEGVVYNARKTEEFKSYIKYMHKLYDAELLDPESLTQDKATYRAKLASGLLGFGNDYATGIAKEFQDEFYTMDVYTAPDGKKYQTSSNMGQGVVQTVWGSVTIGCENPGAAFRWIDMFYDDDVNFLNSYGPHSSIVDGKVFIPEPPEGISGDAWTRENVIYEDAPYFRLSKWTTNIAFDEGSGTAKRIEAVERLMPYRTPFIPGTLLYPEDDYNRKLELETPLVNLIRNKTATWIMNGKIDEEWDAYIDELEKLGEEEWISINQKSYDHWSGK